MDRRAQAEYNAENPKSSLSVPQERQFAFRFSDPTHPANSGSFVSLVTGGKYVPRSRIRARGPIGRIKKATGTEKGIKKVLKQSVLYLMLVNMPTEEEMEEARREVEMEKEKDLGIREEGETD